MDTRNNSGYTITDTIHVGNTEFVLGIHSSDPARFVTWECTGGNNYFWGHYHTDELAAKRDLCERAIDEIKCLEKGHQGKTHKERDFER